MSPVAVEGRWQCPICVLGGHKMHVNNSDNSLVQLLGLAGRLFSQCLKKEKV